MKLAHCLIPILFAASSLIQNAYGTPNTGPQKCPNVVRTCQEGALNNGYMDSRFLIKAMKVPKDSSCPCCALCNQEAKCFSLAFNERTRECRLYNTIAGYTTFLRSDDWKYMISKNSKKSKHLQFCRRNSDCLRAGDACRGRICTTQKTVLCSTIYNVYMQRGKSGEGLGDEIIDTYGWIDGKELRIACMLNSLSPGYTVLFRNFINFKFNEKTIKHYNNDLKDGVAPYSWLGFGEALRKRTKGGTYRLQVYSIPLNSTQTQSFLQLEVPKRHQVIGTKPRTASTHKVKTSDLGCEKVTKYLLDRLSLPYLARVKGPHQGTGKLNTHNGLLSMHNGGAGWGELGLARADGYILMFGGIRGECALLMHE